MGGLTGYCTTRGGFTKTGRYLRRLLFCTGGGGSLGGRSRCLRTLTIGAQYVGRCSLTTLVYRRRVAFQLARFPSSCDKLTHDCCRTTVLSLLRQGPVGNGVGLSGTGRCTSGSRSRRYRTNVVHKLNSCRFALGRLRETESSCLRDRTLCVGAGGRKTTSRLLTELGHLRSEK